MIPVKPTGQLGITGANKAPSPKSKAFELPHSAFQADVSKNYHGKVVDKMNPSEARVNARTFPQTGLGG